MAEIVITYSQAAQQVDSHSLVPYFEARRGQDVISRAWLILSGLGAKITAERLQRDGVEDPADALNRALLRYGVRRMEASVRDLLAGQCAPDQTVGTWRLTNEDVAELLALAAIKICGYQRRNQRDLFCMTPAAEDKMAIYTIDGRKAAPTSRAVCSGRDLPDTDYLCSNLLHPSVVSTEYYQSSRVDRNVLVAMCDLGKEEVDRPLDCRPGGHPCWQRIVDAEPPTVQPVSPLGLSESFDVLDALWRLVYGRNKRLLTLNTATGSAALSLGCTNRVEFESRLSALADVIGRLKVGRDILPPDVDGDEVKKLKSVDLMEKALVYKLSEEQHVDIRVALQTLRKVCQARNAMQHGITEGGGLTAKLREFGAHDAPPNWTGAWEAIRVQTTNALTAIRAELRQWVDSNS